ncbi:MAG: NUDIX domain-containing protein [archaeon]
MESKSQNKFILVGCGALIINDKNEVLLLLRSKDLENEGGMWARPGGKLEFGETVEEAVAREVMEELGVVIKVEKILEVTSIISPKKGTHWVALGYLARIISGTPKNMEPSKSDEVKWFPINSLPKNTSNYTINAVSAYLKMRALK